MDFYEALSGQLFQGHRVEMQKDDVGFICQIWCDTQPGCAVGHCGKGLSMEEALYFAIKEVEMNT